MSDQIIKQVVKQLLLIKVKFSKIVYSILNFLLENTNFRVVSLCMVKYEHFEEITSI